MSSVHALQAILTRKGAFLDGRPLYAYGLGADDVEELRHALARDFERGDLEGVWVPLCVFASEWLHRHYDGGMLTWEPIWNAVGYRGGYFPAYYELLERAFGRLRIALPQGDRREFLAALLCQGGFPIRLLERDDHYVLGFLRRLVHVKQENAKVRFFGVLTDEDLRAAADASGLPVRMRNADFLAASRSLAEIVYEVLASVSSRTEAVARALGPDVRLRIPIREDAGVRSLFAYFATFGEPEGADPIVIEAVLRRSDGVHVFERRLRVPERPSRVQLAGFFGMSPSDVPMRAQVVLECEGQPSVRAFDLQAVAGNESWDLIPRETLSWRSGPWISARMRLLLRRGTETWAVEPDAPSFDDVPCCFADITAEGEEGRWLGSADVRTTRPSVLVVVPAGIVLESGDGRPVHDLGSLHGFDSTVRVFRVAGRARWQRDDGMRGEIAVNARETRARRITYAGTVCTLSGEGSEVWRGPPRILVDGVERNDVKLEWRSSSEDPWRPLDAAVGGRIWIRAREGEVTLDRRRFQIVPTSFRLHSTPEGGGRGYLQIDSRFVTDISVSAPDGVTVQCKKERHAWEIGVTAQAAEPLALTFTFACGGRLTLPILAPVSSYAFLDRSGARVVDGTTVDLERLRDLRARVVTDVECTPSLCMRLLPTSGAPEATFKAAPLTPTGEGGVRELALVDLSEFVSEMLSTAEHPEDGIELILALGPDSRPEARLRVVRIEEGVSRTHAGDIARYELIDADARPSPLRDGLELGLVPLLEPLATPVPIAPASVGVWEINRRHPPPSVTLPALVVPRHAGVVRFRPRHLASVDESRDDLAAAGTGAQALRSALLVEDHVERRVAIDRVLGEVAPLTGKAPRMAATEFDRVWSILSPFLGTLGSIPSATYEAIRAIARHPVLAACAAVEAGSGVDRTRLDRVWNCLAELPLFWHALPVRAWVRAASAWRVGGSAEVKAERQRALLSAWRGFPSCVTALALELIASEVPGIALEGSLLAKCRKDAAARNRLLALLDDRRLLFSRYAVDETLSASLEESIAPVSARESELLHLVVGEERDRSITPRSRRIIIHLVEHAAMLAAAFALNDGPEWRPIAPSRLRALRWARHVLPEFFDFVWATHLTLALARRLTNQPGYYEDD